MIFGISLAVVFSVISLHVMSIIRWKFFLREYPVHSNHDLPFVSILVAVRNEEDNIRDCLDNLLSVDYPKSKYEILVGDDGSEDASYGIIESYSAQYDQIKLFSVKHRVGNAKGKANVLAQLAHRSKANHLLITDADIEVPTSWVKGMLGACSDEVGIVTGFTRIKNNIWQDFDWLFSLGLIKMIADLYKPVTAMGNNMLITREAYNAVGGYENIPFSLTEDFELFRQVRGKGYQAVQVASPSVLAYSKAINNWRTLLHQRKRWMKGAVQLPLPIVLLLLLNALYFPSIVYILVKTWTIGLLILAVKVILQSVFITQVAGTIGGQANRPWLLFYELYSSLVTVGSSLFFLIPLKVTWKGRKY